jgi:glyoxylase-like metal-dependent hydrolase (beta-lactamase superfamily II)
VKRTPTSPPKLLSAQRPGTVTQLSSSVTHFQGATWECNCIAVLGGPEALVIDACWSHADVKRVHDHVGGLDTHLLLTHGDIDHACGAGVFSEATVVGSPETKARVDSGGAEADIVNEAAKWGLEFPRGLRVDHVVEAGAETDLGRFRLATVEAKGHAIDGLGWVLLQEGLFAVGDYLMASQHPMVWWSFSEARQSTERLLGALDRFDLRWVVPGHGPILSVEDAHRIGAEDLAYMEEVERVADEAQRDKVTPREWHLAVESVPVPRPAAPDIEMLCPKLLNVAATFRDRGADGRLPWVMDMA